MSAAADVLGPSDEPGLALGWAGVAAVEGVVSAAADMLGHSIGPDRGVGSRLCRRPSTLSMRT